MADTPQARVAAFLDAHGLAIDASLRYIDLSSEIGELGKALLEATDYGKAAIAPTDDLRLELGDCLFSLLALADALGLNAEDSLGAALAKYEKRFREKGHIASR